MSEQVVRKVRLTPERIATAAIELADRDGIEALTIRALADHLGTKPMTLYHHVAGKEALLDLMVDRIFAEMEAPPEDLPWREAIIRRCQSTREVLVRHPWSVPLLESRSTPGPELLRHHESMLATLDRGGLPLPLMAHAYAILDSFVFGFALEEATLPAQGGEGMADVAEEIAAAFDAEAYPQLVRLTVDHVMQPGYSFGSSFEVGLGIILDGLEAARGPGADA
ncbi:TetR/AcrR family transcriptional regulator C-terminal domain-containing protein [Demequina sp. SYSU T00039]|uniref:TetR/AcrR family transcriptional regulator C-terminal domain-containing protein n=1 Tax=Demequina lignilytica TaxID=3051663 RepID=A0AAW7M821_9MICO|nr:MULTISPECIES: TetR/AcrR family transcriptional regulator C-terminal domain-containing protein [unclassified Demequina]MDN4478477.1 TetR/AcrR family transcriptional regulator C-terminal domain-containing protein [Demequina sp. SYSU T00039-1]MDN4487016.1 TetR/AcrR family transcriptional regulator C-terminal domain-containing protein [Demequina sp. SYSU T00039]